MAIWFLLMILQTAPPAAQDLVRLDFPDTVELKTLVDFVAATLHINVIYDETELNKKVSLRIAGPQPRSSLLGLLRGVLRTRGLALLDADQAGWFKIVAAERLASEGGKPLRELPEGLDDAQAITYVAEVHNGELEKIKTALTPYLSKPGGAILAAPESRSLIITDYARNVRRMAEMIAQLDVGGVASQFETLPVRHQDPADLAQLISRVLVERGKGQPAVPVVSIQPDPVNRGLLVMGTADQVAQVRTLIERFDVAVKRRTELYQPRFVTVARLKSLIEGLLSNTALKIVVDEPGNTLIITARDEEHTQLRELVQRFDLAPQLLTTPLRFYKLLNRRADDVFATIAGILGSKSAENGPNGIGGAGNESGRTSRSATKTGGTGGNANGTTGAGGGGGSGSGESSPFRPGSAGGNEGTEGRAAPAAVHGDNYSIAVDQQTNSILVIGPPELHQQITQLVGALDKRRPQVLVEVTLVSISADEGLDLGVELEQADLDGRWQHLLFTAFGLSTLNAATGARQIQALSGGSGVLIGPDDVPILFHALATNGNTHIYSAPRILVDDNATGRIESVAESPFTSVNASTTVATTSFAGFAKAGTQLSIQPHIAEGDHLEIEYTLTVSSFTGAGSGGAPPPRSSDTISSSVRVPDGNAVIVGGLLTETLADSSSKIPLVGDVPILGFLFGQQTHSKSKVRLYAFIRPTVLRAEGFEDLKYFSQESLKEAEVSDGCPPNRYQYMR